MFSEKLAQALETVRVAEEKDVAGCNCDDEFTCMLCLDVEKAHRALYALLTTMPEVVEVLRSAERLGIAREWRVTKNITADTQRHEEQAYTAMGEAADKLRKKCRPLPEQGA